MVTGLTLTDPIIKETGDRLEKASTEELAVALRTLSASLLESIRKGTFTVGELDTFLTKTVKIPNKLKQFLISEKAWLLLRQNLGADALKCYDEALSVDRKSPITWARKGAALLELSRFDEAFAAFQEAYFLRANFGEQKDRYLKDLFQGWSLGAFLKGLIAVLEENVERLRSGVQEYLEVQQRAKSEGVDGTEVIVLRGQDSESVPQQIRDAVEELELAIKLLSIKDPFEGLRALSKEVSKVWPAGLSAVDAIREQRDREWNT